jgi:hypothetical protein
MVGGGCNSGDVSDGSVSCGFSPYVGQAHVCNESYMRVDGVRLKYWSTFSMQPGIEMSTILAS